ncbi:MAG: type IX secretion system membrane protein PorP/SprF [Cyclobacteriaceae bacterium]|nr:type IX secretion system membrane protein PorP/SprF [Cyclobacteriaceae bacterium]
MVKRIFLSFTALLLFIVVASGQQYPVFTQYYFNELVINPAYAGNHVQLSATAMYRNQWVNFPGAPKTLNFSAHTALMKNKIGVGLMINHDEIGSYKNEHIYGSYAYKIHFQNSTLSMGLQAGFNLLGADFSNLDLDTPGDAAFSKLANVIKPNFGAGLFYSKKNFFAGFSVPFILENKIAGSIESIIANEIREARYYMIRSGTVLPLGRSGNVKINPSILIRFQEGQPMSFDINNAFIFYDVFSFGTSYRLGDSFITFIDLKLSDKIHFGYSYDWTTSDINAFSNGSHEFMLNFRTIIRGVHKNPECPQYYNYR